MIDFLERLDETTAAGWARLVIENVCREYPNHLMHTLGSDADAQTPRRLHPAFYGSYDWHSAVHSHWLLVRLLNVFPEAEFAEDAGAILDTHLTLANIIAERQYLEAPHRLSFERPYGLAWVLQLASELADVGGHRGARWRAAFAPLAALAADRLTHWLPKLGWPVRSGEHSQSAFSFGLVHDWARTTGHATLKELIDAKSRTFYTADVDAPLAYEPSGHDFLSPALAEADLMRRVLPAGDFGVWLTGFLPHIPGNEDTPWLPVAVSADPTDPKLAHLDGLNLSRAWMLEGIASSLPPADPRRAALLASAHRHEAAGLPAVTAGHYEGSHWLPSFAGYLLTHRGMI